VVPCAGGSEKRLAHEIAIYTGFIKWKPIPYNAQNEAAEWLLRFGWPKG
jgi:hypothetical protein